MSVGPTDGYFDPAEFGRIFWTDEDEEDTMGVDSDTARRWATEDDYADERRWAAEDGPKIKLYTAGPMSWIPRFNYPAFMALADTLRATGHVVVSPAELDSPEMQEKCEASLTGDPADLGGDETWGDLLSRDVKIIADEVDGVVLMPGWEDSKGARLEAFVARHVGKPLFYWIGGSMSMADTSEDIHDAICHCDLVPGGYGHGLLELDDAELDHVLTAADTLTLMKMERDARPEPMLGVDYAPNSYALQPAERVVTTGGGTTIFWDVNEGQEGPLTEEQVSGLVHESRPAADALGTPSNVSDSETMTNWQGETRQVDPDTGGEKGSKLARFDLIPAAPLHLLAEHYGRGAEKYEDRNWERGYAWSLSYAALMRHVNAWWRGEDYDDETGSHHLTAAAWHCFALLEWAHKHPEKDDRP